MPILDVRGLGKRFGALKAVNDVSFSVEEGEIVGLIGPNGSGKSTTFNCIAGLLTPNTGSVRLAGSEIAGLPASAICHRGVGRTFQIPRPFRSLTLLENVALSAFFGQDGRIAKTTCWEQAERSAPFGRVCRPTRMRRSTDWEQLRSRSSNLRARSRRNQRCFWPTKASTGLITARWIRPLTC